MIDKWYRTVADWSHRETVGGGSRSSNKAYTHHVTTLYTDTTESGKRGPLTYHPRQERPGCKGQLNTMTDKRMVQLLLHRKKTTTNTLMVNIIDQTRKENDDLNKSLNCAMCICFLSFFFVFIYRWISQCICNYPFGYNLSSMNHYPRCSK